MKSIYLVLGNILSGVLCWAGFRTVQIVPLILSFVWPVCSFIIVGLRIEKSDRESGTYTPSTPRTSLDQQATGLLAFTIVVMMFVIGFAIGSVIWPFATI